METFFRIRKVAVCLVFIVLGLWILDALADYVDLSRGEVIDLSACQSNGKSYSCAIVQFGKETYLVLIDRKGAYAIYQVAGEQFLFLWCRESV